MSRWPDDTVLRRQSTWVGAILAIVAVVLIAVLMASVWAGLGDAGMSAAGWFAMALGILVTLALGVGLMALVFISSRRGFDEPWDGRR